MNRVISRLACIILSIILALSCPGGLLARAEETGLSAEQSNAIAMLNYITVLTSEVNASKNSRVFMEKAYSTLINNTYPNAVDGRTLDQMNGLLDTMESYRMINVKRERLQYVFERSQAQAMRSAIPNPMGLVSLVNAGNPVKLVTAVVYMAVDSYTSYTAYAAEAEQLYLQNDWALDDEEAEVIHQSRKGTFSYMVKMVNDYNLPGDLTLTEDTVRDFVEWKNNPNVVSRIRFLESNRKTYQSYGGYWLTLAESYYENGEYSKCLSAVTNYEGMGIRIFRHDYEYARILPLAIAAARETYLLTNYAPYAAERAQEIIDNTDHSSWALRYFAAQTLVDLYAQTLDQSYLEDAYDITLDNVNYLLREQQALNNAYLEEVQKTAVPKGSEKEVKKQIETYNKMLKELRKTELPPVYEPLMLNCDLLFALIRELDLQESEKIRIDDMLHPGAQRLFLTEGIDDLYWCANPYAQAGGEEIGIHFDGRRITLPAQYLAQDAAVTVTVTEPGEGTEVTFDNWVVEKVKRGEEGDLSTFEGTYLDDALKKYNWKPDSQIKITVTLPDEEAASYDFTFKAESTKDRWYDHIRVWERDILFVRVK